jgi:hypothetical protein
MLQQSLTDGTGPYAPAAVSAAIENARSARSAMDELIRKLAALPATIPGFLDAALLQRYATKQLNPLWPSEWEYVNRLVAARQTQLLNTIIDDWSSSTTKDNQTLEDARAIFAFRRDYQDLLPSVTMSRRNTILQVTDERIHRILFPLIQKSLEAANEIPFTVAGLRSMADWERRFDEDFGSFSSLAAVADARQKWAARRREIFVGALPDWQVTVTGPQVDRAELERLNRELISFFPPTLENAYLIGKYRAAMEIQSNKLNTIEMASQEQENMRNAVSWNSPKVVAPLLGPGSARHMRICNSSSVPIRILTVRTAALGALGDLFGFDGSDTWTLNGFFQIDPDECGGFNWGDGLFDTAVQGFISVAYWTGNAWRVPQFERTGDDQDRGPRFEASERSVCIPFNPKWNARNPAFDDLPPAVFKDLETCAKKGGTLIPLNIWFYHGNADKFQLTLRRESFLSSISVTERR